MFASGIAKTRGRFARNDSTGLRFVLVEGLAGFPILLNGIHKLTSKAPGRRRAFASFSGGWQPSRIRRQRRR
jgi:hypothetical protein